MALRPMPTEAFETRFAALLQQHRERLLGFLRRLCGADADAEDVLQETLEMCIRDSTWNRPPVRNGDAYTMVWCGLAAGSYRLRCREGQRIELVGAPADGFEIDLNGPAATRRLEVVLR